MEEEKTARPWMKTIHLTSWKEYAWEKNEASGFLAFFTGKPAEEDKQQDNKMKELMRELYDAALKDDPKFHFFFEPEIIIRLSSPVIFWTVKLING